LQARETGHDLAGSPLAYPKQFLDGQAGRGRRFLRRALLDDVFKPMKPGWLGVTELLRRDGAK
jgi:hypothetical protein